VWVVFLASLPFLMVFGLPVGEAIALGAIVASVTWLVDVLTVRLVVAGKWRGLLGYET